MNLQRSLTPLAVLVFGESNMGKSIYAGQLYGRLAKESGVLRLREASDDLSPYRAVLESLSGGVEADHTESGVFANVPLKLCGSVGEELDVCWPDYAGEQVKDMIEQRQISPVWHERLRQSEAWLLFVRPALLRDSQDIFNRPVEELLRQPTGAENRGPLVWSDQARIIELLQLLLFARGASALHHVRRPVLGLMLSCWDELRVADGTKPMTVLRERAPLLADFIEARWQRDARFILGVAPQGKPLDKVVPDEAFIDQGPENQGWVVMPDGHHTPDMTLPLVELLRRM